MNVHMCINLASVSLFLLCALKVFVPVFIDYDYKLAFGTPFETALIPGGYLARGKGGRINGYTSYFSYLSEIQLS